MAEKRDCYEILGISKSATEEEIKKAFRRKAKEFHPDANPGDKVAEEKFKEVNEAYSILSDPDKKARYDQYGYAGVDPSAGGGGFGGGFSGGFDMGDIFDMFGGIFGGGGSARSRANAPMRGDDVGVRVTIDFNDAVFGCKRDISFNRIEHCHSCGGSGAEKGTSAQTCRKCGGRGSITVQKRTPFGMMQSSAVCDECGGRGKIIQTPCRDCRGSGTVRKSKTLEVNIPAGIDNGQRISLNGQGDCGVNGGPNGDLLIQVNVRRHDLFMRDGYDIHYELPITFADATLGAKLTVPTPDGSGELAIPEGTQTGTTFTVRGKGVPRINSKSRGDLYITVKVETPKGLSRKQKDLLEEFQNSLSDKHHAKKKIFFDKFKK
ncbi:MAG: molecular chaperone DnaJ [Clostridia bacterium]|nr:molecular chaperone DnaJ [Clostridia bacterium]MBR6783779.1 molecular chaperone DnaJ [Clostridia bacterium]